MHLKRTGISLIQGIPAFPSGSNVSGEGRTDMPTYLVERYWPGVTSELLLEAADRARHVIAEMTREGTRIRDVSCILIPAEEVVFSVYEGPSAAAVRELSERAGIPVSRIVDAIAISGAGQTALPERRRAGGLVPGKALPQPEFLDLAGRGHREGVHEHPVQGCLVRRQPLPAVRPQLFGRGPGLAEGRAHVGGDHLTPGLVRDPDDGRLGDAGVVEQGILDLARVDVLTAPDDHVLDPAFDAQVAPAVQGGQVPGVVPALG